jgi:hypothetical protein
VRYKAPLLWVCAIVIVLGLQLPSRKVIAQNSVLEYSKFADLPDHVAYEFYFLRLAFLYSKPSVREQNGELRKSFRTEIMGPVVLDHSQEQAVHKTALSCLASARELDLKAKAIIREVRSRYRGGKLGIGQPPPGLPPELPTLQAERNSIFLHGRDYLQRQLGDQKFAQLDRFVRLSIGQQQ